MNLYIRQIRKQRKLQKKLGFRPVKGVLSKGAKIFTDGKGRFITRDRTGHKGGAWKMNNKPSGFNSTKTRLGTYDENLNWIAK